MLKIREADPKEASSWLRWLFSHPDRNITAYAQDAFKEEHGGRGRPGPLPDCKYFILYDEPADESPRNLLLVKTREEGASMLFNYCRIFQGSPLESHYKDAHLWIRKAIEEVPIPANAGSIVTGAGIELKRSAFEYLKKDIEKNGFIYNKKAGKAVFDIRIDPSGVCMTLD